MKKETAMQELFGIIENQIGKNFPKEIKEHFINKEKQQIIQAVEWNYKSNMGEVYYNAKFQ